MSKIEIAIDVNGLEAYFCHWITQKQNGESFSNFTELFLLSLLTTWTIIYFIRSCVYSNLKALSHFVLFIEGAL